MDIQIGDKNTLKGNYRSKKWSRKEKTENVHITLHWDATIVAVEGLSLSVALVIQHVMHMRHIVICGASVSSIYFHIFL